MQAGTQAPQSNAAFGINVHLGRSLKAGLVLLGMDAISWADLNTEGIFNA